MKLDGEYVFEAGVQDVWDALFDPAVLAAVLPGCEKLELVDGAYVGDIKVKVGPIQGKFAGKVDLLDKVEPTSYRMIVDGRGAQGFVKATAAIALAAEGAGTKITYTSDAQVGGKIASVGSRLIETSAKAIVKQSLEGLNENIKIRVAAHRAASASVPAPASDAAPQATATASGPPIAAPIAAPDPEPEPVAVAPVPPPVVPVPEYKRADASKLAGAVATEVAKSFLPFILVGIAAIGLVLYLVLR